MYAQVRMTAHRHRAQPRKTPFRESHHGQRPARPKGNIESQPPEAPLRICKVSENA